MYWQVDLPLAKRSVKIGRRARLRRDDLLGGMNVPLDAPRTRARGPPVRFRCGIEPVGGFLTKKP
jgi:hypothetical protein